jgi:leucyl-tRNA synthetase
MAAQQQETSGKSSSSSSRYFDHSAIEAKWQAFWEKTQPFKTAPAGSPEAKQKPKYYVLDMFPYPSSSGLHVGHPEGYTATDIMARYKRARGFNVLHPMGWDAFGLPAEQYALQTGVHPAITTNKAIDTFRGQLKRLGFSYDWNHEISTCSPEYYRWTQFIFLKLFERGLAYRKEVPVNWCPALKTVLANEEVVDGKSERGGHPVYRVPMKQWMLKITDYAERLLRDLDKLDWPESTKELQRNWIGRSEGLECRFKIDGHAQELEIFTTRPDTIFGATYMVLAPEHPLVSVITTSAQRSAVEAYQAEASQKSELARQDQSKRKTGAFTGAFAINPLSGAKTPIWISDYVMMGYGTGAIMAVPAHDERDFEFAQAYDLPIRTVVAPADGSPVEGCFAGEGVSVDSGFITGMPTAKAIAAVIEKAEKESFGSRKIQYKLRDWLFSRQRYWGEPFPIVHDASGASIPVGVESLPVELPNVQSYEPTGTGESPLAAITDWVTVPGGLKRETDTMPGSAGSSWYFLRYIDPRNAAAPFSPEAEKYWMPVDLYLGGPEHAVGHLLYARFWTKVLFDCGLCTHDEPFQKLFHQGMILGPDGEKMSKSRGNVINPDTVVAEYGADTLRLYEMFMGPLERDKKWDTQAIEGVFRFCQRAFRLVAEFPDAPATDADHKILHKTIKKVTEDIEALRFNTAISAMMVFVNHFMKNEKRPTELMVPFVQCLHPFAPHLAEELWEFLGRKDLSHTPWPAFDPALAKDDQVTIAVQVLGKTRGTVEVEADLAKTQDEVVKVAAQEPRVRVFLDGKEIVKTIFVPGKLVNFVVK